MYIVAAILLLAILIVIHELGHFWAARATGIAVSEFSVGMGPKLLSRKSKKTGTVFSLRAIPIGGFCAFYGEDDPTGEGQKDPRAFARQKLWKRLITIAMGPLMNFVLAFVVAAVFYWVSGVSTAVGVDPYISEVMAAGPAYAAGMEAGDVVESINGQDMLDGTMDTLTGTISSWKDGDAPLEMIVRRGEERLTMHLTPVWDAEEGKMRIGVMIGGVYRLETLPVDLGGAIENSWALCVNASGAILRSLRQLVTTGEGLDQTSGPVGIISMVSSEVETGGFSAFIQLLTLISINLGLMNLLPIPGLDGSRLLFGLIELIRRKPIPPRKEAIIHLAGTALLFAALLFFTFKDIMRLF